MIISLAYMNPENSPGIDEKRYRFLVSRKNQGWTNCETEEEWLAKLYYLKEGLEEKKITVEDYNQKEKQLILNWLTKLCR